MTLYRFLQDEMERLKAEPRNARQIADRRRIDPSVWWYEEWGGISIYYETPNGLHVTWIPYKHLAEYVHSAKGEE